LASGFVAELAEHTRRDEPTSARLETLRNKSETSASVSYRMEVRLGVVLRMRAILVSIAGRYYLARRGTAEQRAAFGGLTQCEDLTLRSPTKPLRTSLAEMVPFPPLEDELKLARDVVPAWIGIRFGAVDEGRRQALGVTRGASIVQAVYPQSPAEAAGILVGDIITGPPDAPFQEQGQIREWTMLAEIERPVSLDLMRERDWLTVSLVPGARPVKWPELPGPPKVSEAAPVLGPLRLTPYRGDVPRDPVGRSGHLLFFWATWCGPCKAALPELLAFESDRSVPVIAITDESAETLDPFFKTFDKPFPERVAVDEARRAFRAYGVSGTPTFVLVDGDGRVRSYSTGYSKDKGLGMDGWRWSEPAAVETHP
jgi:thiol-disulfide isomerase/thioredoxin